MTKPNTFILVIFIAFWNLCAAQNVPIQNYSVNTFGQVQLEIEASADKYYLLTALHEPNLNAETITSMTMGVDGTMIISEPGTAYALQNYKITEHSIATPDDTDGDGIDDVTEYNNMPTDAPLNFAEPVAFIDGTTSIPDAATFESLAVVENVPWAPFLNGQQFVKFGILDRDTDEPKVYFINSTTHSIHANFFNSIGANVNGDDGSGEITFNPNEILPNGVIGSYSFNFSFGDAESFESTQRTFELLMANMPFLQNNLQHFIGNGGETTHINNFQNAFVGSRINVVLESELTADVDYIPFHQAEGYGFFRHMDLSETPGSRDIVLYDALPNSLPRVGGIITSVLQTPLSHVNLRAIQDNVPNAYIKEPLMIDSIANLLDNYIYYKVEGESYFIREATIDEVNAWYENLRPTEEQIPVRNLSQTSILPLDEITFDMADAFGAKCANVATMRTFGFPEGTIPNGFGIPFYYYDEFMKYNGFYAQADQMLNDPTFIADLDTRIDMLKDFRKDIKDADMPQWMLDSLQVMHDAFPEGTAVRCRSSTNNEDLPGFSGAGLYTSKTQHLDEGHIKKSVKQVYASMWNFRAYEERDFFRVVHEVAAMGVLCHPNFEEEKSNGVGISIDPVFNTQNTFYLNTQVGESLITNPDPNTIPEEILLNQDPNEGYLVLRYSNLVGLNELIMDESYLDQMRDYLKVIHDEFAILYGVVGAEGFGMDIEYKVTAEDQLVIKQARPWVSFWAEIKSNYDLGVVEIIEPNSSASLGATELVTTEIGNQGLEDMHDFEISLWVEGQLVETLEISDTISPFNSAEYQFTVPVDFSALGDYNTEVIVTDSIDGYSRNDTLTTVISKLHALEGGLIAELKDVKCGEEVDIIAHVSNYGATTFSNTEIEVVVNGLVVDVVSYNFSIPYSVEVDIVITVTENLMPTDNEITLNLLSVNGTPDAVMDNNSSSITTDLDSDFDNVTLIINADNFPQETSWILYDETGNELVASGALDFGDDVYIEDICVDYNSCFTLTVNDEYGDGICCGYGQGDFLMVNSSGDTLLTNDGDFGSSAEESFCLACALTAEVTTTSASDETATDGMISINAFNGTGTYEYSIDGGQTFETSSVFENLIPGTYDIVVRSDAQGCIYEETIEVGFEIINSLNDISLGNIKLYPNPTQENFIIEIDKTIPVSGEFKLEIYNSLGKLIQSDANLNFGNNSKAIISLSKYPAGTFMVKFYNNDFEQYFKVIKI